MAFERITRIIHSAPLIIATIVLVVAIGFTFAGRILTITDRNIHITSEIGSLPPVDSEPDEGVAVLCHHYLRGPTTPLQFTRILGALVLQLPIIQDMGLWTQTASAFENQVRYLKENGYETIDLDELREWQYGMRSIPEKSVVITFDDGDRSVLEVALPILEKYDYKATLFVVTGKVGEYWNGVTSMTWDELKRLHDSGRFSIQSHSHDLHRKVETSAEPQPVFLAAAAGEYEFVGGPWREAVLQDLVASREAIERHLGVPSHYLAWPYGFANPELDSLAIHAGFRGMCTLEAGKNAVHPEEHFARRHMARNGTRLAGYGSAEGNAAALAQYVAPSRIAWDDFEIKRYTITARTSLVTYERMVK